MKHNKKVGFVSELLNALFRVFKPKPNRSIWYTVGDFVVYSPLFADKSSTIYKLKGGNIFPSMLGAYEYLNNNNLNDYAVYETNATTKDIKKIKSIDYLYYLDSDVIITFEYSTLEEFKARYPKLLTNLI